MASSSVRDSSSLPSQYHHFVPRFILKNFAVFKNPGTIKPRTGRGNKRPAPLPSRLNLLAFDTGSLIQEDVAHTFGFVDMYRDVSLLASDPFDLEKRLSRLESDVGRIISDIKRAHDSGRSAVQLKRPEKDLLRRFLFIMLYRNRTLAGRYEKATDEYDANDKEVMLAYMREHGFSRPRDVWFSNIRAFLEVDLSGEWHQWYPELIRRAYPSDVEWFFKNMQCSYLAFCTPENANDEFILTPNAYSIFEGPQSPSGAWTDYHIFAPISPRLLMVTRSYLLPGGLEGEAGEDERLAMLEMSKSMHLNPSAANSCLEDLPIAKANNNYTRLVDGNLVPLATKISREKHIFYFKFFSIKAEHVQKINMIFLEEALGTTSLVYKSPSALRLALEYYLTSQVPGFKQVVRKPHARTQDYVPQLNGEMLDTRNEENRLPYLHLLEKIARCLGSNATAEYTMIGPFPVNDAYQVNPKFREIHCKIGTDARLVAGISWLIFIAGGNSSTLMTDFRQAELVMRLIGITDRIMRASDDRSKDIIRKHREDLISSLPPRRVWLLAKIMKSWSNRKLNAQARKLSNWSQVSFEGIEDALAEASPIFMPTELCRLMYRAVDTEIFMTTHPEFGIINGDITEMDVMNEIALVFDKPGSIRDWGIPLFQEAIGIFSQQYKNLKESHSQTIGDGSFYQFLSKEQMAELWIRHALEISFDKVLESSLTTSEIKALKEILFGNLYRLEFGGRVPKPREPDEDRLVSVLDWIK